MKNTKWKKPSQQLTELFDGVFPEDKGVDRRKMFGFPCAFKNGNLFMGLNQENMFLRLSREDRKTFLELDQASQFEPMPGRIMREYVVVPLWMQKNVEELKEWISKSLVYASSLPSKPKKKRKTANR